MTDEQGTILKAVGHVLNNRLAKLRPEVTNNVEVPEQPAPVVHADMTPIADAIRELAGLVKAPPVTYNVEPATVQTPVQVDTSEIAAAIRVMAEALIQQGKVLEGLLKVLGEKRAPRTLRIKHDDKESVIQEE